MCGIAGIVSSRLETGVREDAVARMVKRQHHRGPAIGKRGEHLRVAGIREPGLCQNGFVQGWRLFRLVLI